jgi:hypothetical protein
MAACPPTDMSKNDWESEAEAIIVATLRREPKPIVRAALCGWGRAPLIIQADDAQTIPTTPGLPQSTDRMWELSLAASQGQSMLVVRSSTSGVASLTVAPGWVLVAELAKWSQVGVAGTFLQTAATQLRSILPPAVANA